MPLRKCKPDEAPAAPARDAGLLEHVPAGARWRAWRRSGRRQLRWLFNGSRPEPLPSHLGPVEKPEPGKRGICCSGGGVRSAAFSLGALQALQAAGELRRASYLSAVSGGSYIAAAVSTVERTGGEDDSDGTLLTPSRPPFAPGSPEEQYLRNRSSYLAPTFLDKLYVAWRIAIGTLVNLAFIVVPLIGASLLLTGLFYAPFLDGLAGACDATGRTCAASPPFGFWLAPAGALGAAAAFGIANVLFRWQSDAWERFVAVWATRMLVLAALLALLLLVLPYLVDWLAHVGGGDDPSAATEGAEPRTGVGAGALGAGLLTLLAGIAAQATRALRGSEEGGGGGGRLKGALAKLGAGAGKALAYLAGGLIGPLLILLVMAFTVGEGMSHVDSGSGVDFGVAAVGAGVLLAFGFLLYPWLDITTWSLHPFYKRRLSSAFSLKRVRASRLGDEERRRVEALVPGEVGDQDEVAVERDYGKRVSLSRTALTESEGSRRWPTLLVCAAANVSDSGATPPGRGVSSFTFSAHAIGGPLVGAVPTRTMEEAFKAPGVEGETKLGERRANKRRRDMTLPAAVAMSGAAVSPSMGKLTRRPLTFLMALANIRLGVWVPNPRWVAAEEGRKRMRRSHSRPRPWYLLCELLGLNGVQGKYLYVTDGGHYENLGLVELLRRGCTQVFCFDAGSVGDGKLEFTALGEAISLARSELGVEIEFNADPQGLQPDPETGEADTDFVVGTIKYPTTPEGKPGPVGKLIYVRNAFTADVPWDVKAHHKADPSFPHASTADQLYTGTRFEAYRVLGERAAKGAIAAM